MSTKYEVMRAYFLSWALPGLSALITLLGNSSGSLYSLLELPIGARSLGRAQPSFRNGVRTKNDVFRTEK